MQKYLRQFLVFYGAFPFYPHLVAIESMFQFITDSISLNKEQQQIAMYNGSYQIFLGGELT